MEIIIKGFIYALIRTKIVKFSFIHKLNSNINNGYLILKKHINIFL